MRWSKLRYLIRERFAASISPRLDIHSAAYGACTCGHAWITLDKQIVANFCTRAYFNLNLGDTTGSNPKMQDLLVAYGEVSRQGAYKSMFDFVHTISIADALKSEDPLVQCLAVVDARVGRRTLEKLGPNGLHQLAARLHTVRCVAEGLTLKSN